MASSGNFPTIGGLEKTPSEMTFSQGNLKYSCSTNQRGFICSQGFPDTGKWYYEMYILGVGGTQDQVFMGVCNPDTMRGNLTQSRGGATGTYGGYVFDNYEGKAYLNGTAQTADSIGYFRSFPQKVGILVNRDDNEIKWTLNGTDVSSAYTIPSGELRPYIGHGGGSTEGSGVFNFGQDSTFGGAVSAGGNADGNSFGDFTFSVPSNYLALSSANLPISSNVDPAETDDDHPQKQFGVVTFTGNGTARTISGLGFQPDFIWGKRRDGTKRQYLVDSNRGFTKYLHAEGTYSEGTSSDGVTSATSDGFAIGSSLDYINGNTMTYVAWCWRANGGTTATNTSGTITTTVQANQAAGFSIVTYAGDNGSWGSTHQDTIGHGLSSAPEFCLFKERNATDAWTVFHHSVGAGGGTTAAHNNLRVDNTDALYTNQSYKSFGGVMPTSTVMTIEGNTTNESTSTHVAYMWHSVEGYSKFGSYTGNGNADGPFVYTGFRPRLMIQKRVDSTGSWRVWDSERHTFNPNDAILRWEGEDAEDTANGVVDFLSNGFKIRMTYAEMNANDGTFVYMCWGDSPFKYNQTF